MMRTISTLCFALMALLVPAVAMADALPAPGAPHLAMRLVAESDKPSAGSDVTLALDTRPEQGWHGYWRNPGDAGYPAEFKWTLPAGASVGPVAWPVPTTLLIAGLMNYVYDAPYAPLGTLHIPAGLAPGTKLPVTLKAAYLVCTASLCVPETQDLHTSLVIGDGAPSADAAAFGAWRRAIPRPLDAAAVYAAAKDGTVRIAIPLPATAMVKDAFLFPVTAAAIDYAAPQAVTREGDRLIVSTRGRPTGAIDGVLRIGPGQGLAIHASPGLLAGATDVSPASVAVWLAALTAFGGALLGGLILNIMPCVFPILSLKALSLARGNVEAREARRDALAYTAGIVLVCLGLGIAILALRAGGSMIGWAFQLQDPRAILLLLLLTVAIAFNLAGLFEMPTPRFAGESGASGAFATGALAAFIATPCTGPFMGAALGAALVLPTVAALAVFIGLGLGLALPFLAIGFVPALRRRLPRPGGWMEIFRRVLSVPMFLTAIALGWVLGRQSGVDALTFALAAALLVALVLWVGGGRQRRGLAFGLAGAGALVAIAAAGVALLPHRATAAVATVGTEPFSERRLASLRAEGRPVFAYFTADWCLTCKVNEKVAIDTAGVRDAFARRRIAVLVGDWTNGDPVLGRFIEAHNRAGVPLYLYYPAGGGEPQVLPQVLAPGLLEALGA